MAFAGDIGGNAQSLPVPRSHELGVSLASVTPLAAVDSPSRAELGLDYQHYFASPALRVGGGVRWQPGAPFTSWPVDLYADIACVFDGPMNFRPFVGLELGWTGFNRLVVPEKDWPEGVVRAHQERLSKLYFGSVAAPLNFRHRSLTLSTLTLHLDALGYEAHGLRLRVELLRVGGAW
ncbi:MAG TPA: hypothetical protein VFQ61_35520 [Polyangiaceae bacterium]|nr:hypothetical protein [Polyangiaceae bacterium]